MELAHFKFGEEVVAINVDRIDGIVHHRTGTRTNPPQCSIYVGGADNPFLVDGTVEEITKAIRMFTEPQRKEVEE